MRSSSTPEGKHLIFIPFSLKENCLPLLSTALEWQTTMREAGKKVPEIVLYHNNKMLSLKESNLTIHTQFSEQTVTPNTTIYLLAHGLGDARWISNTETMQDDTYNLPIELAAKRAKAMGLTPEMANNLKAFSLFICETSNRQSTRSLAIAFAHELGIQYEYLSLNYYSAKVLTPTLGLDHKVKKRAMLASHCHFALFGPLPDNMSKETEKALVDFYYKNLVPAKKHKHVLCVGEALTQSIRPLDTKTQWCLMEDNAISQRAENFYNRLQLHAPSDEMNASASTMRY